MTKRLTFRDTDLDRRRFVRIFEAVHIGGMIPSQERTLDVYRREGKLLDLLESISVSDPAAEKIQGRIEARQLRLNSEAEITLDQADIDLIQSRLKIPGLWWPSVARAVADAYDWLSAAPNAEAGGV